MKSGGVRSQPQDDPDHQGRGPQATPASVPCLWPQKELGTKPGDEALRTNRKGVAFQKKPGRREVKSHDPLRIRCAEVLEGVKGTSVDGP